MALARQTGPCTWLDNFDIKAIDGEDLMPIILSHAIFPTFGPSTENNKAPIFTQAQAWLDNFEDLGFTLGPSISFKALIDFPKRLPDFKALYGFTIRP